MSSHVSCKTTHLQDAETAGKLIDETLVAALTEVLSFYPIYFRNPSLTLKFLSSVAQPT